MFKKIGFVVVFMALVSLAFSQRSINLFGSNASALKKALTVNAANTDTLFMCEGDSLQLGGSPVAFGGTPPYSFSWTPAFMVSNPIDSTPYYVMTASNWVKLTVTDASPTSVTDSVYVRFLPVPSAQAGNRYDTLCLGDTIVLGGNAGDPTAQGGTGPLTILWSPNTNISSTSAPNPNAWPTSTITYDLLVTDSMGCTNRDTITVTVGSQLIADAGPLTAETCENDSVQVGGSPTASGSFGGYTYSWSPISTGGINTPTVSNPYVRPTPTPPASVMVKVVVTDSYVCTAEDSINVTVRPFPTVNLAYTDTLKCSLDTIVMGGSPTAFGGTGPLTYSWSPLTALLGGSTSPNPSTFVSSSTNYIVIVTDSIGCQGTDTVKITIAPSPFANAGSSFTICAGDSVQIGGSPSGSGGTGSLNYSWNPTTNLSSGTAPNPYAKPTSTTVYGLTVSDANNCTYTDTMTVFVPNPINVSLSATAINYCITDSVQLGGSPTATGGGGPLTYSWSPTTGLDNPNSANPMAAPPGNITYILTVGDGFCNVNDTVVLTAYNRPNINVGTNLYTICQGDSVNLGGFPAGSGGSGILSFNWSPSTGISNPSAPNPWAKPSVTTTYTLTVSDTVVCSRSDTVRINVRPSPIADAGTTPINLCFKDTVQLGGSPSGSGGTGTLTYSWSPSTGLSSPSATNPNCFVTNTTTYTLTVTDANNCVGRDQVTVNVRALPTAQAGFPSTVVCSTDTLILGGSPSGSGGSGTLSYSWTPTTDVYGPTLANPPASPDTTITYYLTVTDSFGCQGVDSIRVNVNIAPDVDLSGMVINPGICDSSNASITGITVTGTPTLLYQWTDSTTTVSSSLVLSGVQGGSYYLSVRDGNNCVTKVGPIVLPQLTGPSIDSTNGFVVDATCGLSNGAITGLIANGGNGTVTYSWYNGGSLIGSTQNITALSSGNYLLVIADTNNCTDSLSLVVTAIPYTAANAVFDYVEIPYETTTSINALLNDAGGSASSLVILTSPINGTASVIGGGLVSYTPNPEFSGLDSMLYQICETTCSTCDEATIYVKVGEAPPVDPEDIPTGFTPNGDGYNDLLIIPNIQANANNELVVLNRWGDVVYQAQPYKNDWDGTSNAGGKVPDGTYYIIVNYDGVSEPYKAALEIKTK